MGFSKAVIGLATAAVAVVAVSVPLISSADAGDRPGTPPSRHQDVEPSVSPSATPTKEPDAPARGIGTAISSSAPASDD